MKKVMNIHNKEHYLEELKECQTALIPFNIKIYVEEIRSKSRDSNLVFHRALIAYILKLKQYPLSKIGGIINRDHASVIHLLTKYHKSSFSNKSYLKICNALKKNLGGDAALKQINYHYAQIEKLNKYIERTKNGTNDIAKS